MKEIELTYEKFEEEVMRSDKPVLVDFWATWCGPCRMLGPVIAKIAEERDDVKVCKVNVDDEPLLAQQFNVMNIPTVLVFRNGELVNKSVGFKPMQQILDLLNQ